MVEAQKPDQADEETYHYSAIDQSCTSKCAEKKYAVDHLCEGACISGFVYEPFRVGRHCLVYMSKASQP